MTNIDLKKLANVPLAKPGFDALSMTAPVMVQLNPDGKWENCAPADLEEERLKAVVQHLVNSQALSAAHSYCVQCAAESQKTGGKSNYIPVIMMPICPADQCPFDMECEVNKIKKSDEVKPKTKKTKPTEHAMEDQKEKSKPKKRGFVMQRLTDFDLLSQW